MKTRAWLFEVCDPNLSGLKRPFRQESGGDEWDCASNSTVAIMVRGPAHFPEDADAPPVAAFIDRELALQMVFGRTRRVDLEALRTWAAPNGAVVEAGRDEDGRALYRLDDHQPTTLFGIGVNRCSVWLALRYFRNPNPDVAWRGALHTDGELDPILIVPDERNAPAPWVVAIMPMKAKIEGDRSAFDAGGPGFDTELG